MMKSVMDNNIKQLVLVSGRIIAGFACIALTVFSVSVQASASAFKTGKRYNFNGKLTATILPDPDKNDPLKYAAKRQTYNAEGMLESVESGFLDQWPPYTLKPEDWEHNGYNFHVKSVVHFTYDNWGRKLSEQTTDSQGVAYRLTQFSYDSLGRLRCKALRMNSAELVYSSSACVATSGANGEDRITRYSYDTKNRITLVEKAYGTSLRQDYAKYTYNDFWKKSSITDANGNYTKLQYDGFGRLKKTIFPSANQSGASNPSDYERYSYDVKGNRTSLRKRDGKTITYQYDNLNRITFKNLPNSTAKDVYYSYNLQGLELNARYGSTTGYGVTTHYNGFGEITSETTTTAVDSHSVRYQHDLNGNVIRITYPDNHYFVYRYDDLNRLRALEDEFGTALDSYTYDNYARPQTLTAGGSTTTLSYDTISRMNGIQYQFNGNNYDLNMGFKHNPASQITQQTLSNNLFEHKGGSGPSGSYGVNGLNQYTSFGGKSFDYDANANMTSTGDTDFTYDVENRLISASGSHNVTLTYDPKGRLQTINPSSGATTAFVYAGDALIAEYQNGQMTHRYVHGGGTEAPLVTYTGSGIGSASRQYLHTNHQGSVIAATSPGGVVDIINTYDAYGIPGDNNQGRFAYTGQLYLPSLGLYYYKARIYNPELGRFMQTDPVGYEDQMNLYAYVGNDPLSNLDPSGERTVGLNFGFSVQGPAFLPYRGAISVGVAFDTNNRDLGLMWSHEHGVGAAAPGAAVDSFLNVLWTSEDMGIDDLRGNSVSISGSANTPFYGLGPSGAISFPVGIDFDKNGEAYLPRDLDFHGVVKEIGVDIGSPGVDVGVTFQVTHTAKTSVLGKASSWLSGGNDSTNRSDQDMSGGRVEACLDMGAQVQQGGCH